MFLSRVKVTESVAEKSQLGLLLKDHTYGVHRLLWDLFSDTSGFLYREETTKEQLNTPRNLPLYYVLSKSQPDKPSLLFDVETKPFTPTLVTGESLLFKLRANPIIAKKNPDKKHSQRHDVIMNAQRDFLINACHERSLETIAKNKGSLQKVLLSHEDFSGKDGVRSLKKKMDLAIESAVHNWLSKRGDLYGFELESVQATSYRWHALPEKGKTAGFSSIDYEGRLKVTSSILFTQMLVDGLGPSKAFGCGLMLIRRNQSLVNR